MQGFFEVDIFAALDWTQLLPNHTQAKRKQYGLKHYVTITIHADMGYTIKSMATEIS